MSYLILIFTSQKAVLDEIRAIEERNLRKALENLIKDFEVLGIK